jgi:hypothetical protein
MTKQKGSFVKYIKFLFYKLPLMLTVRQSKNNSIRNKTKNVLKKKSIRKNKKYIYIYTDIMTNLGKDAKRNERLITYWK